METQATTLPARARPHSLRLEASLRYLAILVALGLSLAVIQIYRLENRTFFYVAALTAGGFAIHALLPLAYRLPFFVGLSFAGIALAFSLVDTAWLVGLGLVLIGLCHLPVRFWLRVLLVLVVGALLAIARARVVPTPVGTGVWPILGSIFMFRLALYLHALKHGEAERSVARTLAYFFMLPNVSFALFPVIDYQTFRRNYFDADAWSIYETGLLWTVRGLTQLLLYRVVYLQFTLQVDEVRSLGDLLQFLLANFLLYVRVSGQFHLVVGMLHLFGFRLPETHHLYYLSSSFTDFWRRINIYWKDFMVKLVYYPSFFRLRRLGNRTAIALATTIVFVATWVLHSYQWFWLRGSFPITVPDTLFWGILGIFVVFASLRESERGRRRVVGKPSWSASLGLRTVGMFCILTVLWSLWSATSVVEWIWMWRAAGTATWREIAALVGFLTLGFAIAGRPWGAQTLARRERTSFVRQPAVRAIATLIVLLVLAQPAVRSAISEPTRQMVVAMQNPGLSSVDATLRVRGYYEQLDDRGAINGQALWEEVGQRPVDWVELSTDNLLHARPDFLITTLKPSFSFSWNGHRTSTNRWGMRDRDYSLEKPAGTYRIAILGPSLTMGNGVNDAEVFENLLEQRLAREPLSDRFRHIEVLNFGVNGYSLPQQLTALEEQVLRFHPDLVLLSESPYFRDGISRFLQRVLWENRAVPDSGLRRILASGGLYPFRTTGVAVPFATARRVAGFMGIETRMTWDESRMRIKNVALPVALWSTEQLAAAIRAAGAVPVIVGLAAADPLPKDADAWVEIGRRSGLLVFDETHVFAGRDLASVRVAPWDNHFNALGHQLVADRIYQQLREHAAVLGLGPAGTQTATR